MNIWNKSAQTIPIKYIKKRQIFFVSNDNHCIFAMLIYKVESSDGRVSSTSFMGKLTTTRIRDPRGYEINVRVVRGTTREFYYLDGNTIAIRENGTVKHYFAFTDNWAMGKGLFSKVTLGVGPVNLTIGKGQRILQWENNLGNIAFNSFGLINTAFGGRIYFDTQNLTFKYTGGLMDVFQPAKFERAGHLYSTSAGFSPHTVTGNSNLEEVFKHELHHLWHSRALNDMFLLNYGLQGFGKFAFKIDGVSHVSWFRKKMNEFREAIGIPKPRPNRGMQL